MIEPNSAQGQSAPEQGPLSDRERLDEVYKTLRPQADTQAPEATPVGGMWERLKDRLIGDDAQKERAKDLHRLREMARAVPRGIAKAAEATIKTGLEGTLALSQGLGLTEGTNEQKQAAQQDLRAKQVLPIDKILGPRSDDPIASLTESVVQGITSVIALRGAGLGLKSAAATGAIVDAVAFNPYEAGLSELLAAHGEKVPLVGKAVSALGQLGSVDQEDSFVISRAKRVVEGSIVGHILGKAVDVVVAGTSRLRAQRVLSDPATKPAQRVAAEETIKKADETLDAINDGTHTPDGAKVAARPNADGTWRIEEIDQMMAENELALTKSKNLLEGKAKDLPAALLKKSSETTLGGNTQTTFQLPNGEEAIVLWSKKENGSLRVAFMGSTGGEGSLGPANVRQVMRQLRDETGATKVTGERISGANPGREVEREMPSPRMTRTEAETQAATMDYALRQADSPKGAVFSDADVKAHFETAEKIKAAKNGQEAIDLVGGEDHFNLGAIEDGEDFNAQLRAVISRYRDSFNDAKGRPKISNDETINAAAAAAKEIGIEDWAKHVSQQTADPITLSIETVMKVAGLKQAGRQVSGHASVLAARPRDPAVMAEGRRLLDLWHTLSLNTMHTRSELGRSMQVLQAVSEDRIGKVRFASESAAQKPTGAKGVQQGAKAVEAKLTDSMSDEEVAMYLRLFERGGGEIRNVHAVQKAMQKGMADMAQRHAEMGAVSKVADDVFGIFVNAILSGAKTLQSVAYSGALMNQLESASRVLAGVGTGNPALIREGVDHWHAQWRYAWENTKAAAASYAQNRSVLEGSAPMYIRGGITKTLQAVGSRPLIGADEFTRATGYRANEFAKAMRQAREAGLTGAAAVKQAETDVRFSVDQQTGIALNPRSLDQSNVATLSDDLGFGTAGYHIEQAVRKIPPLRFVVPFVKPSVNLFRYAWANTPLLNLTNARARSIMKAGGEEAATLHARSALVGSLMFYTWTEFTAGRMTGNGPSNPVLRKTWLGNGNQPYSKKIGETWVSYRRMEPMSSWMSIVADASEALNEMDDSGDQTLGAGFAAVFAATVQNSYNKAWMTGLARVMEAAQEENGSRWGSVWNETLAGFHPNFIKQFNNDPYLREARGLVDRLRARTPGISETLPLKYNYVGEPIMRQGGLWDRNFSMAPRASAQTKVLETALLEDNIKLTPYPTKVESGQVDLLDPRWEKNGKLPYTRLMDHLQEQDLRGLLEALVKSKAWDTMSPGSPTFPEGERGARIKAIKDREEDEALRKVKAEFPTLAQAIQDAKRLRPLAKYKGPDAEAAAREKYGIPVPKR